MSAGIVSHIAAVSEVIEECCHIDTPTRVDAGEGSAIVDLMWADFIERRIALESRSESKQQVITEVENLLNSSNSSAITWTACDSATSDLSSSVWTKYLKEPWEASKIHLITFTRSPPSLYIALQKGRE